MTTSPSTTVIRDRTTNLPRARLVERVDYTDDLMVIKMEPQGFDFKFKPGQYCTLGSGWHRTGVFNRLRPSRTPVGNLRRAGA